MRRKGLVIGLLMMLAVVVSGFTYAFWAGAVEQADSNVPGTVTIGTGGTSTVTLDFVPASTAGLVLVPAEYVNVGEGKVNSVVLQFDVEWNEDEENTAGASGVLEVELGDYSLGTLNKAAVDSIFTITVTAGDEVPITMNGAKVTVEVTIVFTNEPTYAQYEQVAGELLSIPVTVTVGGLN